MTHTRGLEMKNFVALFSHCYLLYCVGICWSSAYRSDDVNLSFSGFFFSSQHYRTWIHDWGSCSPPQRWFNKANEKDCCSNQEFLHLKFISINVLCSKKHGHRVDLQKHLDPWWASWRRQRWGKPPWDRRTVREKPREEPDSKGIDIKSYWPVSLSRI